MNAQFQSWFSQGKAVEALCGLGNFFVPDVTYREEHDFVLAVGELLEWARQGNREDAARSVTTAVNALLDAGRFKNALRLLRSYFILRKEMQIQLPLDESGLASRLGRAAHEAAEQLSRDEALRNLLLLVSQDVPSLKATIGVA
ncbi:MAG TPA: hypothetical protein VF773_10785 [Verrucomicrobiae bacterium]